MGLEAKARRDVPKFIQSLYNNWKDWRRDGKLLDNVKTFKKAMSLFMNTKTPDLRHLNYTNQQKQNYTQFSHPFYWQIKKDCPQVEG